MDDVPHVNGWTVIDDLGEKEVKTDGTKEAVHGADEEAGECGQAGDADALDGANGQPGQEEAWFVFLEEQTPDGSIFFLKW